MLTMQRANDRSPLGLGLGWFLGRNGRQPIAEHSGGGPGIESLLRIYPRRDMAVAVLGSVSGYAPGSVIGYVAELLR